MTHNGRVRPRDEGGAPFELDLRFLTPDQRRLWDENFPTLKRWTHGSICQVTMLDLWSFAHICMLEGDRPQWPPELGEKLNGYAVALREYRENMRRAQRGGRDE